MRRTPKISSIPQDLQNRIHALRGHQVMLDRDIAQLYGVTAIRLREQAKRNPGRFPPDFMFRLTETEVETMVSQNAIPSRQHLGGSLPFAFTEQGVASLSGVLTSDRAVEVYIGIMRAFVAMRRTLQANAGIIQRLDTVEKRHLTLESETNRRFEEVFSALEGPGTLPKQGVYYEGQIHDAHAFVSELIRSARKSIVLIDNYANDSVFTLLAKRMPKVTALLYTRAISPALALDLKKHNAQYPPVEVREFRSAHDRFLILDGKTVYHIGASLKDLGKKWFAFSRFDKEAVAMLDRLS